MTRPRAADDFAAIEHGCWTYVASGNGRSVATQPNDHQEPPAIRPPGFQDKSASLAEAISRSWTVTR